MMTAELSLQAAGSWQLSLADLVRLDWAFYLGSHWCPRLHTLLPVELQRVTGQVESLLGTPFPHHRLVQHLLPFSSLDCTSRFKGTFLSIRPARGIFPNPVGNAKHWIAGGFPSKRNTPDSGQACNFPVGCEWGRKLLEFPTLVSDLVSGQNDITFNAYLVDMFHVDNSIVSTLSTR
ncbi:hypothetical protein chiPu_0003940 [Chiloscyllium punctatum]|uniref:Uncharacterized protein n=1 Tax=Chiloscyllium punctatum TaxID=137246 RepID=A0A401S5B7_CHIPU|nr:hypothetical protein [Chiloscyllium punctatum]